MANKLAIVLALACLCSQGVFSFPRNLNSEAREAIHQYKEAIEASVKIAHSKIDSLEKKLNDYSLQLIGDASSQLFDIVAKGIDDIQKSTQEANDLGFDVHECTDEPLDILMSLPGDYVIQITDCINQRVEDGENQLKLANSELEDIIYLETELQEEFQRCKNVPGEDVCLSKLIVTANHYTNTMPKNVQHLLEVLDTYSAKWLSDMDQCAHNKIPEAKLKVAYTVKEVFECIIYLIQGGF